MATAGVINGSDFFMYDSKTLIGHATSHTLSVTMNAIDSSSKDAAGWEDNIGGIRAWEASGDGLYTFDDTYGFSQLMAIITARTLIMVKLSTTTSTNKYYYGYGRLTSLTLNAPNEDASTYSFSFKGKGALTEATGT